MTGVIRRRSSMNATGMLVVLCLAGVSTGCDGGRRAPAQSGRQETATPSKGQVRARVQEMLDIGEQRVFGPDGPKYQVPESYFEYCRAHPGIAIEVLRTRVTSSDGLRRMNAIEFLAELAELPAVRDEAHELIRSRVDDDAEFVGSYAASRLKGTPTSMPARSETGGS